MNKLVLLGICYSVNVLAADINFPERASTKTKQTDFIAKQELVVTNNKWASQAAFDILNQGGSATDAAISAGFVLGLTEPQSSGLGGGGYALVYNNNNMLAYDGRETAPKTANPDWFKKANGSYMDFAEAHLTSHAVGVPSEVALFQKLHADYGKLPWNQLLKPAIKLAKNGFPMSPRLYTLLMSESSTICLDKDVQKVYCDKNGKVKIIGSIVINNNYAHTLDLIAKNPHSFYTGKIALDIINKVNSYANQMIMSKQDFNDYKVIVQKPLCAKYRDKYNVCSIPPSSSGGITMLEMLAIYEQLTQTKNANDIKWQYNFLQASKLAFADRNKYIADPKFVNNPITGLLNQQYIQQRASLVSQKSGLVTPVKYGNPQGVINTLGADNESKAHGTTSLIVVDKNKQAITMTVTIENQFGSHLFVDGFFLNNELTDFALNPYDNESMLVANRVEAMKRPRSSITPVIVLDQQNKLSYALGSPGGSQIICYVAKSFIQMADFGYTPAMASASANLCSTNSATIVERGLTTDSALATLQSLEPQPIILSELISGEVNVKFESNYMIGAADPRREGIALGK